MESFKSILIPVDFTDVAENAFEYALNLASDIGASLDLIYCVSTATASVEAMAFDPSFFGDIVDSATENMQQFIEAGRKNTGVTDAQVSVNFDIKLGDLTEIVRAQVTDNNHDLVLMGTHGAKGFWDELLGTNATSMLGNTPCPFYIVPDKATYHKLDRICFATPPKAVDIKAVSETVQALHAFSPKIHFVRILRENEVTNNQIDKQALSTSVNAESIVFKELERNDVTEALIEYADYTDCRLIIMTRPHYSFWDSIIHRSVTREATMASKIPLLIIGRE